ncbi:two-component system C4-dicarboxylate transport response regulator DctD [Novosphingobium taihuense]|uniref:Two-component system C4-dicarboxylate transport response regulator DctD n=2 Tax=Novosphingobium taihuense TaxID=260085 RepID=A0A7W7A9E5_9SPHN|nr:sigma-54 dependent transcriptional regulator [Novosphingobium taihuense]MBB4612864.1 two-component system C4-dicarboxylate transport response regulator DctD [Novosphingobium taihuense]TWH81947.1 two-component system C4-dicarboxylate transport response regulator DctD [Novosphingobium taihuense]
MASARGKVALVEDDDDLRLATAQLLSLADFDVVAFERADAALGVVDAGWEGVVVTDIRMPGMSGIELFRTLQQRDPELPVILVTGHGDIAMAVETLKSGAWDFLTKPFSPDELLAAVERALRARTLALENRRLKAEAVTEYSSLLVGSSPAITRLRSMIPALADSDLDILIEGETGTGKELYARLLHRAGKRSRHRLLTLNCASLPADLEDELFAPVGASSLASANRGTVVLDNLDLASSSLQARLVQLAEERVLRARGSRDPIPLDIRIVATAGTTADRAEERIAPALFYRVAAVRLQMPPLRDRRDDVRTLFAHHVAQVSARLRKQIPDLTPVVSEFLSVHPWPGNVRELAHYAERFVLGLLDQRAEQSSISNGKSLPERVDAFERDAIIKAVRDANGEIGQAISMLGVPRKTFYYRIKKLGVDLAQLKREK